MPNVKRFLPWTLIGAVLVLYTVLFAAGTPWADSSSDIPKSSILSGYVNSKSNWQTGSGSPAGSASGTEGKDTYTDTTGHKMWYSKGGTTWSQILSDIAAVTVAQGGTGLATLTAHAIYAGNGTSAPTAIGPDSSSTKALFSAGSSTDPAFRAIANTDLPSATLATGTSVSLTAPRQYYVCTGTCTVTPPVPAAGYEFCVLNDNNVATVITLAALGSSARYEATARTSYGSAGTGTIASGGAAGDKICIVGRDSTHYFTVSYNGTWTLAN